MDETKVLCLDSGSGYLNLHVMKDRIVHTLNQCQFLVLILYYNLVIYNYWGTLDGS